MHALTRPLQRGGTLRLPAPARHHLTLQPTTYGRLAATRQAPPVAALLLHAARAAQASPWPGQAAQLLPATRAQCCQGAVCVARQRTSTRALRPRLRRARAPTGLWVEGGERGVGAGVRWQTQRGTQHAAHTQLMPMWQHPPTAAGAAGHDAAQLQQLLLALRGGGVERALAKVDKENLRRHSDNW